MRLSESQSLWYSKKVMYDDGLSIAFGAVDVLFYMSLYIFLNLMNRESFHENLIVRGIIGTIIVDLISHWFVIFFESEFTCTEKYEQADLSLEGKFSTNFLQTSARFFISRVGCFSRLKSGENA